MGFGRPRRILRAPAPIGGARRSGFRSRHRPSSGRCACRRAGIVARSEKALKGDQARTQFIIGLERPVEFQVFSLTNPNRVFVELPDVKLQLPPQPGDAPVGLIKSFRGGLSAPGKARVVIDVTGPVIVDGP